MDIFAARLQLLGGVIDATIARSRLLSTTRDPMRGPKVGAEGRDRTGDLAITNRSLYQLSYFGLYFGDPFFNLLQRSSSLGIWNHRIKLQCSSHVTVPQNRLRDFRIYSTRMKVCGESPAKRVPTLPV
jgi:hypothetical protein